MQNFYLAQEFSFIIFTGPNCKRYHELKWGRHHNSPWQDSQAFPDKDISAPLTIAAVEEAGVVVAVVVLPLVRAAGLGLLLWNES